MLATPILWTLLITLGMLIVCVIGLFFLAVLMEALGETDEDHFDTFKKE
jgi:Na+-transporting methylmalonyl-CoA/oxaloacetate decarboxylase gamma subunit